jgi:hypothetical protein
MDAARSSLGVAAGGHTLEVPARTSEDIATLPKDLSTLNQEALRDAMNARDERLSVLFRRWPALSKIERRELRRLHEERLRLAKYVGKQRGQRSAAVPSSARD